MTTYIVTVPPTANNCFTGVFRNRKTRAYRNWIRGELNALIAQRGRPCPMPCAVKITLPETMRGDLDNRVKPLMDLIVRAGIIPDDRATYVRVIEVETGDVEMAHIRVEHFDGGDGPLVPVL